MQKTKAGHVESWEHDPPGPQIAPCTYILAEFVVTIAY